MSSAVQQFSVSASAAVAAMQRNRVDHVVTVPDWVQLALHQQLEAGVAGMRLVNCSSENQVVTVAAGLVIGGKRPQLKKTDVKTGEQIQSRCCAARITAIGA